MEKLIQVNKHVEHYAELLEYAKEKCVLEQYSDQIMESFADDFEFEISDCTEEYEYEQIENALDQIAYMLDDFEFYDYWERVHDRKITILEELEEAQENTSPRSRISSHQNDISNKQLQEMFSSLLCKM